MGHMIVTCCACKAAIWSGEIHPQTSIKKSYGRYCCHDGCIYVPSFHPPPIVLQELLIGSTKEAK